MKALYSRVIKPYWFESATPTFIIKRIKKYGVDPESLNGTQLTYSHLIAIGTSTGNSAALMFQTGYLTIASYEPRRMRYTLCFPSREVEIGFAQNLLPQYAPATDKTDSPFCLQNFQDDLDNGDPKSYLKRLEALFKDLPGEDHRESTYRAITYLLCLLSGTEAMPERHSYKGRSDLEVLTDDYIYVFEFKYNKSLKEARDQILDRDYAGRYKMDNRKVFLIAVNISDNKENRVFEYEIIK